MPWHLIDHQADVGLQATGASLEEALADGVRGLLSLMVDTGTIADEATVTINVSAGDPAALYVELLNAVLAAVDIHRCFYRDIQIEQLSERNDELHLRATLTGEPIDLHRHVVDSDVKAATYGGLRASSEQGQWRLRCILDL